ncbi:hypothetical protein PAI11_27180 [Patulibacter medicamentivorans]|uniref:Peptidase S1 domain-containing protein n=2 Tax=Patulibacter medicamentivorans TaxID=1097667 RepID=H0E7B6_9ACTN|nr:hypothetical protein PAI11_27180 [Patulibacter medicamentivorans]
MAPLPLAAVLVLAAGAPPAQAIVGGVAATSIQGYDGSFQRLDSPRSDGHVCGATLIAPRWAITAGHCARWARGGDTEYRNSGTPKGWSIRFGSRDTRRGGQVVGVQRFVARSVARRPHADIALLRLSRAVHVSPARLATRPLPPGTRVRIQGWGFTDPAGDSTSYGAFQDPRSYPRKLRVASTRIRATRDCGTVARILCIGGKRGRPGPENMDSGGPAFARQPGRGTVIVGTVEGGGNTGAPSPSAYAPISLNLEWIRSYLSGRRAIPRAPAYRGPDMRGAAKIGGCSASVVRARGARAGDPALLLTNGHCVDPRPKSGTALADRPVPTPVQLLGRDGTPIARSLTDRLLYATMTGTDVALYRLTDSYQRLEQTGVRVLTLASRGPKPGDRVSLLTHQELKRCRIDIIVPTLREAGYEQQNALRYVAGDGCRSQRGDSGAPLIDDGSGQVVAINNTHNSGERDPTPEEIEAGDFEPKPGVPCAEGNPCEVGPDGRIVNLVGRSYGQQAAGLAACIAPGSRLRLDRPGCTVTKPGRR